MFFRKVDASPRYLVHFSLGGAEVALGIFYFPMCRLIGSMSIAIGWMSGPQRDVSFSRAVLVAGRKTFGHQVCGCVRTPDPNFRKFRCNVVGREQDGLMRRQSAGNGLYEMNVGVSSLCFGCVSYISQCGRLAICPGSRTHDRWCSRRCGVSWNRIRRLAPSARTKSRIP